MIFAFHLRVNASEKFTQKDNENLKHARPHYLNKINEEKKWLFLYNWNQKNNFQVFKTITARHHSHVQTNFYDDLTPYLISLTSY